MFGKINLFLHWSNLLYLTRIVGHQSAKTTRSGKSAKFFILRKTANFFSPHLAALAATANLYVRLAISFLSKIDKFNHKFISAKFFEYDNF